jgi:hypothetical protein
VKIISLLRSFGIAYMRQLKTAEMKFIEAKRDGRRLAQLGWALVYGFMFIPFLILALIIAGFDPAG